MKRSLFVLMFAFVTLFVVAACGGGGSDCSPACATGEVCIAEGGTPACKKSCTKDEDCDTGQKCHTDEEKPHCDAEE